MDRAHVTCCLLLAAIVLGGGCASKKFSTTLDRPEYVHPTADGRFSITRVSSLPPEAFFITGYTASDYWVTAVKDAGDIDDFLADLNAAAGSMYPGLFVPDGSGLPLDVTITTGNYKSTNVLSGFFAAVTWGVLGLVLPLPVSFECDFDVTVACPAGRVQGSTRFCSRLTAWISFPSPLALIPVPGASDQRACALYPYQTRYYSGRQFTLESFVTAIVASLQEAGCLQ